MKPSKVASFSCQATARGSSLGAQRFELRSLKNGRSKSRRSTSSTSQSLRWLARSKIHRAGLSAKRVARVEPMITAMRGFVVTGGLLLKLVSESTLPELSYLHESARRHLHVPR